MERLGGDEKRALNSGTYMKKIQEIMSVFSQLSETHQDLAIAIARLLAEGGELAQAGALASGHRASTGGAVSLPPAVSYVHQCRCK